MHLDWLSETRLATTSKIRLPPDIPRKNVQLVGWCWPYAIASGFWR